MKFTTLLTCASLLGGGIFLTGCVDPYYSSGGTTVMASHSYRPGYAVTRLPRGYRSEIISGSRYYHYDGVYYRQRGNSYVVVERPARSSWTGRTGRGYDRGRAPGYYDRSSGRGADVHVLRSLPRQHRVVTHRGRTYYQVGDDYYERGDRGYVRVRVSF